MKRILFFFFAVATFAAATHAQTVVTGQSEVLGAGTGTVVYGLSAKGSVVEGQSILLGSTILDYHPATGAQIFAIFPPSYSASTTTDYYYFVHNVLTQPSIDGVNIPITWSKIELSAPLMTKTGACAGYTTFDTDTCVKDAAGFYHIYNWAFYDGHGCATNNNIQIWFGICTSEFSQKKIVNLYFIGVDAGATNTSTPEYVTDPNYYNFFSPMVQDVMNSVNGSACSLQQWMGYSNVALSESGGTVMSTLAAPSSSWQTNDMIWIKSNPAGPCDVTSQAGTPVTIDPVSGKFSYGSPGILCTGSFSSEVVGASDSFPVPYELPYTTAYRAALTALFLHFYSGYMPMDASSPVGSQLGYIRFGQAIGGEAYPYCATYMASLPNGYDFGGGTNWPCDWTGFTSADAAAECMMNSDAPNPGYYGASLQWAQSKSPYMAIYAPLNQYGGDNNYGKREAEQATIYGASNGRLTGFGSQGASLTDTAAGINGCALSVSYWCTSFQSYYGTGAPLELQQAGLSDPFDSTCRPPRSIGSNGCANPPQGDSGDLRYWLPLEVASHANVIELYYLDAALAFDANYCTTPLGADGLTCLTGYDVPGFTQGYVNSTLQGQFYAAVGQGTNCPGSPGGTLSTGDCSYAAAINAAHKAH